MSMKLASLLRMKYSSAMLRPPDTEKRLSATNSLLCILRLMRPNSCADSRRRGRGREPPREGSGLNSRTSTLAIAAKLAEQLVLAAGVEVVDQQAHAHAALGGIAQRAQELQADAVVGQVVVLDVERALGPLRQRQPGIEGEVAGRQQPEARFAGAGLLQAGGGELAEAGADGVGHRRARGPLGQRRQAGAAGERCAQKEHDRRQEAEWRGRLTRCRRRREGPALGGV